METRELTADDVVYCINYSLEENAPVCQPWKLEVSKFATATGRYTVVQELYKLCPDWQFYLGYGAPTNIFPHELVEAGMHDWRNAVGTGPFMLTDYITGTVAEYTRNLNYWDTTVIDGKEYQTPFVDKFELILLYDDATKLAAMRTGLVDIWEDSPWVYRETLTDTNPEIRTWDAPAWGAYMSYIKQDIGPPLDILEVRQAMMMAIDHQAIVDDLYGGSGVVLNFIVPASDPESIYTPLEEQPPEVRAMYEYHPEEAKQMLADAGYPNGFALEATIKTDALDVDLMSMVKDYWAAVGIDLTLKTVESAAYWGVLTSRGFKDMMGFFDDSSTPAANFMSSYLDKTISTSNASAWYDPIMAGMWVDYTKVLDDVDAANAIMKKMNNYVISQCPVLFLPGYNSCRYAWPWVKNYEGETQSGYLNSVNIYERIWIDQNLKVEMGY